MIYADPSFLFSFYAKDANTPEAVRVYAGDQRRPLILTAWQRFEFRNSVRLAIHKLRRAGQAVPFQQGNVFKLMDEDLAAGRLKHEEPQWRDAFRLVEDISAEHTESLGAAAVDLWHVASAILLRADTFWTFDCDQYALAKAVGRFRRVPDLTV